MNKMRFDDALSILAEDNKQFKDFPKGMVEGQHYAGKCNCQQCAYCAYWRLRELVWAFYDIRLNSRVLDKHIQSLYE